MDKLESESVRAAISPNTDRSIALAPFLAKATIRYRIALESIGSGLVFDVRPAVLTVQTDEAALRLAVVSLAKAIVDAALPTEPVRICAAECINDDVQIVIAHPNVNRQFFLGQIRELNGDKSADTPFALAEKQLHARTMIELSEYGEALIELRIPRRRPTVSKSFRAEAAV